jgi:hypothetical protein
MARIRELGPSQEGLRGFALRGTAQEIGDATSSTAKTPERQVIGTHGIASALHVPDDREAGVDQHWGRANREFDPSEALKSSGPTPVP